MITRWPGGGTNTTGTCAPDMSRVVARSGLSLVDGYSSRFCYGHCGDRCYHGAPLTFWIITMIRHHSRRRHTKGQTPARTLSFERLDQFPSADALLPPRFCGRVLVVALRLRHVGGRGLLCVLT